MGRVDLGHGTLIGAVIGDAPVELLREHDPGSAQPGLIVAMDLLPEPLKDMKSALAVHQNILWRKGASSLLGTWCGCCRNVHDASKETSRASQNDPLQADGLSAAGARMNRCSNDILLSMRIQ
jgi:hypothetical protein